MNILFIIGLTAVFVITSLLWFVYVSKLTGKLEYLNKNIEREVSFKTADGSKFLEKSFNDLKSNVPILQQESYLEGFNKGKDENKVDLIKTLDTVKVLESTLNILRESSAKIKYDSYLEGYEKGKSEFSVQVSPYRDEEKSGSDGLIFNDIYHEVIIGYQYQLIINGVPALKPAIIIEERLIEEKREVDFNKIERVSNFVESKIKALVTESKGVVKYIK